MHNWNTVSAITHKCMARLILASFPLVLQIQPFESSSDKLVDMFVHRVLHLSCWWAGARLVVCMHAHCWPCSTSTQSPLLWASCVRTHRNQKLVRANCYLKATEASIVWYCGNIVLYVVQYVTLLFIGGISATSLRGFLRTTRKVMLCANCLCSLLRQ